MARLLHTGDTHLGYQQYHSPERREDFRRAFGRVIDDAIEMGVDAVVHAGDLFQNRHPDLPELQAVIKDLRRLRDAGIPFLSIVGNHEGKRDEQWLDLLASLELAERLDDTPRVVDDIALYGLDYVPPTLRSTLDYEFKQHDADYAALVAHGLFEPFQGADWDTETVLTTTNIPFDALLLGDNHTPGKRQVNDTWVTYPGSTERASASEREERGYNIITTDEHLQISRRTLPTRSFVFIDIELEAGDGDEIVRRRVRERMSELDDAVVIVTIEGDGEAIVPGPIEELAKEHGALIARVNDRRDLDGTSGEEYSVSFADPDAAVEDRLQERSMSAVTREIDRTIRDETVADSNLRDVVRTRIDEQLEEDLAVFDTDSEKPEQSTTESSDDPTDTAPTDTQTSMEEYL